MAPLSASLSAILAAQASARTELAPMRDEPGPRGAPHPSVFLPCPSNNGPNRHLISARRARTAIKRDEGGR
eukprot:11204550-Lingulodinium_polyedra.AAC.1